MKQVHCRERALELPTERKEEQDAYAQLGENVRHMFQQETDSSFCYTFQVWSERRVRNPRSSRDALHHSAAVRHLRNPLGRNEASRFNHRKPCSSACTDGGRIGQFKKLGWMFFVQALPRFRRICSHHIDGQRKLQSKIDPCMRREAVPVPDSLSMNSILIAVGRISFSFCSPSRGPTSTIFTREGSFENTERMLRSAPIAGCLRERFVRSTRGERRKKGRKKTQPHFT